MNNKRREELGKITEIFLKAIDGAFTYYSDKLTEIRDEEQEAYDNLPDSIKESDKGWEMDDCINAIGELLDTLNLDNFESCYDIDNMLNTCNVEVDY